MEKEFEIIFEDEGILVINKSHGLVVNRSNTYKDVTLQDLIEQKYPDLFDKVIDEQYISRSGIVHRLDKDTSGIIVVAKNVDNFYFLQKQFKERRTYKEYKVVAHGHIEDEIVEIEAPLGRSPKNPLKMAVVSTGKQALTKIEREKLLNIEESFYTLAKVFLKTGRTHQIRVHLNAINHPVAGDKIYCANNLLEKDLNIFSRMMLHAHFLGFTNPTTQKFQRFESPLPKEFKI